MASEFKLSYTAAEVNERLGRVDILAKKSELPTKTSDLINDSDFVSKNYVRNYAQPIDDYALKSDIPTDYLTEIPNEYITETKLNAKGYLTNFIEEDPTVPDWAKQPNKPDYTASEVGADAEGTASAVVNDHNENEGAHSDIRQLISNLSTSYDESIIGLSVDGQTVTYIKGDGSVHTIITQDTDTTYSIGTDETTGLTKLYATTGSAEDGTMTQKAIKTELDKKVGVSMDDAQSMLIFTI